MNINIYIYYTAITLDNNRAILGIETIGAIWGNCCKGSQLLTRDKLFFKMKLWFVVNTNGHHGEITVRGNADVLHQN